VDPARRYQSAAEMRSDVLRLCDELGGRLSQAEIKEYMARRFAAERRREEREIDEALQHDARPARESEPPGYGSTKRIEHKSPAKGIMVGVEPSPLPKARVRWWVYLAVAVLGAAVLARVLGPTSEEPRAASADAATATVPDAAVSVSVVSAPEPTSATEQVSAAPAVPAPDKLRKPTRAPVARPAPAASDSRRLQLDRQDPWRE
jgi:hypothetical protein